MREILDAARDLFFEHGFEAVTMDAVSRASRISKATLYAHFVSKEAVFEAVVRDECRLMNDAIWLSDAQRGDVADTLRQAARNFVATFMTQRALRLRRAIVGAVQRFPEIGRVVFETGPGVMSDRVARFLAQAHDEGRLDVPDPALAAVQFLSIMRGDIDIKGMLGLEMPAPAEIDTQIERGIAFFLARYGRRPRSRRDRSGRAGRLNPAFRRRRDEY